MGWIKQYFLDSSPSSQQTSGNNNGFEGGYFFHFEAASGLNDDDDDEYCSDDVDSGESTSGPTKKRKSGSNSAGNAGGDGLNGPQPSRNTLGVGDANSSTSIPLLNQAGMAWVRYGDAVSTIVPSSVGGGRNQPSSEIPRNDFWYQLRKSEKDRHDGLSITGCELFPSQLAPGEKKEFILNLDYYAEKASFSYDLFVRTSHVFDLDSQMYFNASVSFDVPLAAFKVLQSVKPLELSKGVFRYGFLMIFMAIVTCVVFCAVTRTVTCCCPEMDFNMSFMEFLGMLWMSTKQVFLNACSLNTLSTRLYPVAEWMMKMFSYFLQGLQLCFGGVAVPIKFVSDKVRRTWRSV